METKHWIFLAGCLMVLPIGASLAVFSRRARDLFVILMFYMTTLPDTFDVNLFGRELYRAASRGIAFSLVDVLAVCVLTGCLLGRQPGVRKWIWPPALAPMLGFLAWCVGSVLTHEPWIFGTFELTKIARGILVFVTLATYVRDERELRVVVVGLMAAIYHEGWVVLRDRYVGGVHRVRGTLGSWNQLSMFGNACVPVLMAATFSDEGKWFRRFCAVATLLAVACVILPISRTGFAVLFVVTSLHGLLLIPARAWLRPSPRGLAVILMTVIGATAIVYKASDSLMSRYDDASLEDELEGTRGRGMYLRLGQMVLRDHPFGVGLNNWSWVVTRDYYPELGLESVPYESTEVDLSGLTRKQMVRDIAPPAHNLFILTAGEVGLAGLFLFLLVWASWLRVGGGFLRLRSVSLSSRLGLGCFWSVIAVLLCNVTEYGFRHPPTFTLMHLLTGAMMGAHRLRQGRTLAGQPKPRRTAWSPVDRSAAPETT